MKKLNLVAVAAASVMASQVAVAQYTAPTPVYATVSPAFRTGDLHNFYGEEMVRVTRITGLDQNGQRVVLFSDKGGAILPRVELENVAMLINPGLVEREGEYRNLTVTLADKAFSVDKARIVHKSLASTELNMQGSIQVDKYEVNSSGLRF